MEGRVCVCTSVMRVGLGLGAGPGPGPEPGPGLGLYYAVSLRTVQSVGPEEDVDRVLRCCRRSGCGWTKGLVAG